MFKEQADDNKAGLGEHVTTWLDYGVQFKIDS
jgi:hypothetical protein